MFGRQYRSWTCSTKKVQVVTHRAHASLQRAPQVLETQLPTSRYELCDTHIWETHMRDNTSDVNTVAVVLQTARINIHLGCNIRFEYASTYAAHAPHPHALSYMRLQHSTCANMSKCWLIGMWNSCQLQSTHFRGNGSTNALFKGLWFRKTNCSCFQSGCI